MQVIHNIKAQSGGTTAGMTARARHAKLVEQTEKWVALSFYGTMLKQMRDDPFKSKLFDGGEGGQAFSELYDQELAQRMSHGTARKLVDSIVRRIEGSRAAAAYARQGADAVKAISTAGLDLGNSSPERQTR